MKKRVAFRAAAMLLAAVLVLSVACGCSVPAERPENPAAEANSNLTADQAEEFTARLTLPQKASQMVQAQYDAIAERDMKKLPVGSVLSGGGDFSNSGWKISQWQTMINGYQSALLGSDCPVPMLYGIDAVHGVGKMSGAVVFPHNIGIGAANDPELTYQMGQAVANEMKLAGIRLNFAPCVAVSDDPRWGRTYECYSSDTAIVTGLGEAFAEGLLSQGVMPCAKHFIGDGSTEYGTAYGSNGTPLDRGNTVMDMNELRERLLLPYEALIDAGVKVIMPSHGSVNGVRMHENKELLTDLLKNELGFDGFVISDWESVNELSGESLEENVVLAINAGVDMLMQPYNYKEVIDIIIDAGKSGAIPMERIDDAVTRIIRVKIEMGLFSDPYGENDPSAVTELGTEEYRELAGELVKKSLVLLKNENNVLPLARNTKVLVIGQALDDVGVLCGGWTGSWQGATEKESGSAIAGTTILDGLKECAARYGIEIITDESRVDEADVVLIGLGEKPYAEWDGDSDDISVTGNDALTSNRKVIDIAEGSGKPVVALIVAGRNVFVSDYIDNWDAAVMCYLPGTEAGVIGPMLCGEGEFTGRLPMPWYLNNKDIESENPQYLFNIGHGLSLN